MIVFDVKCHVLEPIHVSDAKGKDITLGPGYYRLRGLERLIRGRAENAAVSGTDLRLIADGNGESYDIPAEKLANFLAYDEVEVTV